MIFAGQQVPRFAARAAADEGGAREAVDDRAEGVPISTLYPIDHRVSELASGTRPLPAHWLERT